MAAVACNRGGVAVMAKNIAAGCVLAALIFMGLLAYAQKHHECVNGRLVIKALGHHRHLTKVFKPCGSVDAQM